MLGLWLLCLLLTQVVGEQTSELRVENSWPGGMTAEICVTHDMEIDCGWEMEILFSKPVTVFEIWSAVVKTKTDADGGTKVVIRHLDWSEIQGQTACHRFNAYYSAMPEVTASYTKVCQGDDWTDVGGSSGSGETATQTPSGGDPKDVDYSVDIRSSWRKGIYGEICLFHTVPITCGFDAELIFSPPIKKLEIWSMAIVDEIRTSTEVRYKLKNMNWGQEQPDNPTCHPFLGRHTRRNKPEVIMGRYTRVCNNGQDNFDPNQGGTSPPATTTPEPTTTTSVTTTTTESTTTPEATTTTTMSTPSTTTTSTTSGPTVSTTSATTTTTVSTTAGTTVKPTTRPPNNLDFDYYDSLEKSMLFYFAQRSGPINDEIVPWRTADSAMTDGNDVSRDLVGGWYDAGDHVKFNFPMAGSATALLWGFLKWGDAYESIGKTDMMYDLVKQPLDYFLKCWDNDNQILYGQVGDGHVDHSNWERPEDMTASRPTFKLDANNGGSDLAGETAAAMAAGALVFKTEDPAYSSVLLKAAEEVYDFADKHRRMYHESITNAADFYKSWDGYYDELCWGAAWLLKATGNEMYRTKAKAAMAQMNQYPVEFSWDSKAIGCYVLMYEQSTGADKDTYRSRIESFMNKWVNFQGDVKETGCGLAYLRQWGALRYSANSALIALMAAENGIEATTYREWAEKQIKYMLGANAQKFSYQVGFGTDFPLRPHHQSATCPVSPGACNWDTYHSSAPNANQLTGALVGGPGQNDDYADVRSDYVKNEVTTDYNAGFQSSLAGLISLHLSNELPNATPKC